MNRDSKPSRHNNSISKPRSPVAAVSEPTSHPTSFVYGQHNHGSFQNNGNAYHNAAPPRIDQELFRTPEQTHAMTLMLFNPVDADALQHLAQCEAAAQRKWQSGFTRNLVAYAKTLARYERPAADTHQYAQGLQLTRMLADRRWSPQQSLDMLENLRFNIHDPASIYRARADIGLLEPELAREATDVVFSNMDTLVAQIDAGALVWDPAVSRLRPPSPAVSQPSPDPPASPAAVANVAYSSASSTSSQHSGSETNIATDSESDDAASPLHTVD